MESVALSKVAPQPSLSGVVVLCAWKFDVWYQNALPLFHVSCSSLRGAPCRRQLRPGCSQAAVLSSCPCARAFALCHAVLRRCQ